MTARAHLSLGTLSSLALAASLLAACSSNGGGPNAAEGSARPGDGSGGGSSDMSSAAGGDAMATGAGSGGAGLDDELGSAAGDTRAGAAGMSASVALPEPLPSVARIMAVGDSITRATCWRALLWERLSQSFPGRFDFVGTSSSDSGCAPAGYDRDNQGYSSSLITEIVAGVTSARTCDPAPCPTLEDLSTAFTTATPDIVLMHFGTNDVWNSRPTDAIIDAYTAVLGALREANPSVRVLAAQIIPMNVTETTCTGCTCANCSANIDALNAQLETWAAAQSTEASPVAVVDQWTGFDTSTDTGDGVHPNAAGSRKMADAWFAALEPLFTTQ